MMSREERVAQAAARFYMLLGLVHGIHGHEDGKKCDEEEHMTIATAIILPALAAQFDVRGYEILEEARTKGRHVVLAVNPQDLHHDLEKAMSRW
jgi:hypothetical protein